MENLILDYSSTGDCTINETKTNHFDLLSGKTIASTLLSIPIGASVDLGFYTVAEITDGVLKECVVISIHASANAIADKSG